MASPVKYVTSTPSGSIVNGNVALGINSIDYGPSSTTGWYPGINPPEGKYVIYETNVSGIPNIYIPNNTTELIAFVVSRGGTAANEAAALQWIAGQSNLFIISYDYPNIVTNGLILLLDAKSVESYPTTGSIWRDLSGQNTSGSLINGPTFNQGQGAIVLDGIDDFINQNFYTSTYYGINQSWTIDVSLNIISSQSAGNTRGGVVTNQLYQTETNPGGFGLNIISQNYCINLTSGSTGAALSQEVLAQIPINYNKNERITALFDSSSSTVRIYRNGVLANSSTSVNYKWTPRSVGLTQRIGTSTQGGWGFYFPMKFYNVSLYSKALSQQEILQNYYQGPIVTDGLVLAVDAGNIVSYESGSTITYNLTGSLSGSLVNGTGFLVNSGGVWDFDGTNDYITFPNDNSLNLTQTGGAVSVWFKTNVNATGSINGNLVAKTNTYTNGYWLTKFNDKLRISLYGSGNLEMIGTKIITDGVWHHVVGTWTSNQLSLYVDGVLDKSQNYNFTFTTAINPLYIGRQNNPGEGFFKGNIANVQIYNRALSAQEVAQNFTAQQNRFI